MKKLFAFFVIACFLLSLLGVSSADADHGEQGSSRCSSCPFKSRAYGYDDEKYACPITGKLMGKAHFYLENQKELGLTEEQVNSIKALKLETKKIYLRQMADHQIFELDMNHKLSETKVDVAGIQAMIDQHTASMTSSAKETVAAYAKLKSVLSGEQIAKAKEFWVAKKS